MTRMGDDLQFEDSDNPRTYGARARARRHTGVLTKPSSGPGFAGVHAGERQPRAATPLHHKHGQERHQQSRATYRTPLTSTKPLLSPLNRRPSHLRSSTEPRFLVGDYLQQDIYLQRHFFRSRPEGGGQRPGADRLLFPRVFSDSWFVVSMDDTVDSLRQISSVATGLFARFLELGFSSRGGELPRRHDLPLSRFSRIELHRLVLERGVTEASASTIWRWLHEDAIKPWQTRSWIFPRDPDFAAKAGRALDLYARVFDGKRLRPDEYVISADEKTRTQ